MGSGKTEALTVLIENDELNKDFKNYFNMLWNLGQKVNELPKIHYPEE